MPKHRNSFDVFLRCVLRSVILDEIRRVTRRPLVEQIDADFPDPGSDPAEWLERRELIATLQRMLDRLTASERAVMALVLAGWSPKEIAAELGIRTEAVRRRRARAISKMAQMHVDSGLD